MCYSMRLGLLRIIKSHSVLEIDLSLSNHMLWVDIWTELLYHVHILQWDVVKVCG